MTQENHPSGNASDAPGSYLTIDLEMSRRKKRNRSRKTFFSVALGLVSLWVLLYFTLSFFQVSNMSISGLTNLTKEDYFQLSGYSENQSLLFFSPDVSNETAVKNSSGLLLDCLVTSNPFKSKSYVHENHPVGSYQGKVYTANGKLASDLISDVKSNQVLPESNKARIVSSLEAQQDNQDSLPSIHLENATATMDESHQGKAFSVLAGCRSSLLSQIDSIQYRDDSSDGTFSNVMDVVIEGTDSELLVIKNVLYDYFDLIFDNSKQPLKHNIEMLEQTINSKKIALGSYTYLDDSSSINAYLFTVSYPASGHYTIS